MDHDASAPGIELHSVSDFSSPYHLRSTSQTSLAYQLRDRSAISSSPMEDEHDRSRPQSPLSTNENPLLQTEPFPPNQPPIDAYTNEQIEPRAAATHRKRWLNVLYCLPHMVPLAATITILTLNIRGVYWQDLGRPNQNTILQVLQYAAKAHELTMAASLTAIVIHQIQYDLSSSKGISLGFLTAGFRLSDPLSVCTREFLGGAMARVHSEGMSPFSALTYLLVLGVTLTLVVGPSSAIAMIPRLHWWEVSKMDAFGPLYTDRVYLNRTEDELWPGNITNVIYADMNKCDGIDSQDCAVGAADVVGPWVSLHQSQGTKPNITIFQDYEVTRYLTSQGGPPDNSSFTVSSTVGSVFAKDLDHYWDWLVENSSLPLNIDRPLLRPAFKNSSIKMRKPLVSAQCQTYFHPDYEHEAFEFPHDELVTPPLDEFKNDTWSLPNDFVLNLKGDDSDIGNPKDKSHPYILFRWFDTATEFSNKGAPSLGAVVIYQTTNSTDLFEALTTCSFDGRWAPVEYYLDPKDVVTVYQDSPNPMDILNGSSKAAAKDLIQMRMSLDWAKTMNVKGSDPNIPSTTVVEQILQNFGHGNFIYPEPEPELKTGYVMKSLNWRLSTTLGLYLTESLAHAFSDVNKGSMLYRQAPELNQSYVRYLEDINQPALKRFYTNGKLDWVEMRDPLWNSSFQPWDEWAPRNGYTEIIFTVQRNGYGYGFEGVPIKLATLVLAIYVLLVCGHVVSVLISGHVYKGYSTVSDMVALAWNSAPAREVSDIAAGTEKLQTWSLVVRAKEEDQRPQLVLESMRTTVIR